MELQTISNVSKMYGVSRRMLCYYEDVGLIKSSRKSDYAYRVYDENEIKKLKQIIILRKLQIPIKQIKDILNNQNAVEIIEIFKQNIDELDEQITALSTVKSILARFVNELQEKADVHLKIDLLNNNTMLAVVNTLSFSENKIRENVTIEELNKAAEQTHKLTDRDVRIIYLPPMTVASVYAQGTEPGPELTTGELLNKFISDTNLKEIYPAARHFGFNNPDEPVHGEGHGYERYITIPDDMEVSLPFVKKQLKSSLYAAYTIPFGEWDAWFKLHEWVFNNEYYDFGDNEIEDVCGWIEEHLNYWNWYASGLSMGEVDKFRQIELMIPIQKK